MAQPKLNAEQIDVGTGANQIVQLDGSGNLPSTDGPKFNSYLTNAENMTNVQFTWNTTNFTSLSYDAIGGSPDGWTPSTGVFQPSVAGYYFIGYQLHAENFGSFSIGVHIYKNNSIEAYISSGTNGSGLTYYASSGAIVYMNGSTDYLDVRIGSADSSWFLSGTVTHERSRIYGFRVI